jgi:hypothetical protein
MQQVLDNAKDSTLLAYFKLNQTDAAAQALLYQEIPQHFTWNATKKQWSRRKRGFAIGRMYLAHANSGERFYLRLLLTHVRGATSFEHLRTVDGVVYGSLKEACRVLGLLQDDGEWAQCLAEASDIQTGSQLRNLFAVILRECNPADPVGLWNRFKDHICDDLAHRLGVIYPNEDISQERVYDYGLWLLDQILHRSNKSLQEYPPMPLPQENWILIQGNPLIAEQLNYDKVNQALMAAERVEKMNGEQRRAFYAIVLSVQDDLGTTFFLNGPGGTGKSFVYNTLCHELRSEGKIVICVASSGIAALILDGGTTAHYRFRVPIPISAEDTCRITKNSPEAELLRATHLLLFDELPMIHRHIPEAIDRSLRDIRSQNKPFGGLTVVFGGDWQQILPVIPKASRAMTIAASFKKSHLWSSVEVLYLTENRRLGQSQTDRDYAKWLQEVGKGQHTDDHYNIQLPASFKCPENTAESLIQQIYPGIDHLPYPSDAFLLQRSILCAKNDDVDNINSTILESFPGEETVYQSADHAVREEGADAHDLEFPTEYLNSIKASGLPLSRLVLKIGVPIIILRNLDAQHGVCNGSRAVVTKLCSRVIEARLLGGHHAGKTVFIPRLTITPSDLQLPFQLSRRQFPVRLAFAMTINKSQGQSLDVIGLDFRHPVFTHGQFYVAVSRATSAANIKAIWFAASDNDNTTTNIVFKEILQ